jgi:hypothetical protein
MEGIMQNEQTAGAAVVEAMQEDLVDNGATGTVNQPAETAETARPGEGLESAQPEQVQPEEQTEPVMDGEEQTAIPGTVPDPEEEPEDEREPRSKGDIAADFRMAIFNGDIEKITEDWNKGRSYKIQINSSDRSRLTKGLEKFSSADDLMFRVLPRQRVLRSDEEPEDFGSKVPNFGVEMVERLERKSCDGFNGWQDMTAPELYKRMEEIMRELEDCTLVNAHRVDDAIPEPEVDRILLKNSVDLANFAFFMWWKTKARAAQ